MDEVCPTCGIRIEIYEGRHLAHQVETLIALLVRLVEAVERLERRA